MAIFQALDSIAENCFKSLRVEGEHHKYIYEGNLRYREGLLK